MIKIYFALLPVLGFASCASTLNYIGSSYTPTEKIDVFVDEAAIPKNYTIVGKGYVRNRTWSTPENIQTKAIAKAKQKGADAVLIKDYYVPVIPVVNTSVQTDSSGKGRLTIGNAVVPQTSAPEFIVLFLKYK